MRITVNRQALECGVRTSMLLSAKTLIAQARRCLHDVCDQLFCFEALAALRVHEAAWFGSVTSLHVTLGRCRVL